MSEIISSELAIGAKVAYEVSLEGCAEASQLKHRMKQIFFSWPNLADLTLRFAGLVSHKFPDVREGGYLLTNTLVKCADAYVSARSKHQKEMDPPGAFINAMLDSASGIASIDVYGVNGAHSTRWNVGEEALTEYAALYEKIVFEPITPKQNEILGTRLVLLGSILTVEDASLIKDTSCSEARCFFKPPQAAIALAPVR